MVNICGSHNGHGETSESAGLRARDQPASPSSPWSSMVKRSLAKNIDFNRCSSFRSGPCSRSALTTCGLPFVGVEDRSSGKLGRLEQILRFTASRNAFHRRCFWIPLLGYFTALSILQFASSIPKSRLPLPKVNPLLVCRLSGQVHPHPETSCK